VNFGTNATTYLRELHGKLDIAKSCAASHAEREQNRYAAHYNLRSRDKYFDVGKCILVLMPDSTSSRMFSKWSGPGTIVKVRSPYSYIVDVDGVHRHFHANKLRKFHVHVDSVTCDSLNDDLETSSMNTCAITYESDTDFGQLSTIPSTLSQSKSILLLSQKIDPESISYLTQKLQTELLEVLDRYPECFSDIPGDIDVIEHTITLSVRVVNEKERERRAPKAQESRRRGGGRGAAGAEVERRRREDRGAVRR